MRTATPLVSGRYLATDAQRRLYVADPQTRCVFRIQDDRWTDLGGASTVGAAGSPALETTGSLTAGSATTIDLTHATPSGLVLGWLSVSTAPFAAFGGTIHATPPNLQRLFLADGQGELHLGLAWPAGIGPGTDLYLQFLLQDGTVPAGITVSNANRATTP